MQIQNFIIREQNNFFNLPGFFGRQEVRLKVVGVQRGFHAVNKPVLARYILLSAKPHCVRVFICLTGICTKIFHIRLQHNRKLLIRSGSVLVGTVKRRSGSTKSYSSVWIQIQLKFWNLADPDPSQRTLFESHNNNKIMFIIMYSTDAV